MGYKAQIQQLAETTDMDNKEIAASIGCTERTVRRYAGRYKTRMQNRVGYTPGKRIPAKILLFDIETSPMEVYVWSLISKQNMYISPGNVIKDWAVLSWSAKWLMESDIMSMRATTDEARNRDDKRLTKGLWNLFDEAHIVIAHNAIQFDVRRMNARFIKNQMTPPLPYRMIDTLKEARKTFDFPSYKLDYLNERFGLSMKIETNFNLWKRCVTGDESALVEMEAYNTSDVAALEELYLVLRPWIKSHPPISLYNDCIEAEACPTCGSENLDWGGQYMTPAGRYEAFRCEDCGAIGRSRYSDLTKEDRQNLVISTAR